MVARAVSIRDKKWRVSRAYSSISNSNGYSEGVVFTPNGIVQVYSQGNENVVSNTTLQFVHNGMCYTRNFNRRYSCRYLKTLSIRFANEVLKKQKKRK